MPLLPVGPTKKGPGLQEVPWPHCLGARLRRRAPSANVSTTAGRSARRSGASVLRLTDVRAHRARVCLCSGRLARLRSPGWRARRPATWTRRSGTAERSSCRLRRTARRPRPRRCKRTTRVVMVGTNLQMAPPPPPPAPPTRAQLEDEDFFAVRLDANGAVDPSFGSNGIVRTPIDLDPGARDVARGVAVGPGGSIVVVGDAWRANFDSDVAFVRYTPAGELDPSFSGDGIQTVDLGPQDIGYGAVVQPRREDRRCRDHPDVQRVRGRETERRRVARSVVRLGRGRANPDRKRASLGDESLDGRARRQSDRRWRGHRLRHRCAATSPSLATSSDGQLDPTLRDRRNRRDARRRGRADPSGRAVTSGGKILAAGYGGSGSTRCVFASRAISVTEASTRRSAAPGS